MSPPLVAINKMSLAADSPLLSYQILYLLHAMGKSKLHRKVTRECLDAVVRGPFFPDWEFVTLFGFTKEEIKAILDKWPDVDMNNDLIKIAINNSFNNLTGYPINNEEKWSEFISVSRSKLKKYMPAGEKKFYN